MSSQIADTVRTDRVHDSLGARRWQQPTLEAFQILTETLLWFVVIAVLATTAERSFLRGLLEDTLRLTSSELGVQREGAERASEVVAAAINSTQVGPSYPFFVLTAVGGFLLVRTLSRIGITGVFGAIVVLFSSVMALNLLLHLGLAGDLRVWDSSGFAGFLDQPDTYFASGFDVEGFVADPQLTEAHGAALVTSAVGVIGVWVRFMYIGRSPVTLNTVLRSFTVGFAAMLVAVVVARVEGIGSVTTLAAIPYFVLGVLSMAAGQAARASFGIEGVRKTAPWVVSMAVTGVTLLLVGTLLGLFALLNVQAGLAVAGAVLGEILRIGLLIIITPIFWILQPIFDFILPDGGAGLRERFGAFDEVAQGAEEAAEEGDPLFTIPGWLRPLIRLLGLLTLFVLVFLLARALIRRRPDGGDGYDEVREHIEGTPTGVGALLRGLLGRGGKREREEHWLERHAVYRLFARSLYDSQERGLPRFDGETPMEFAAVARRSFEQPLFEDIAAAFDEARYGRHYREDDELRPLADALVAWEEATPATEELRNRIQGAEQRDNRSAEIQGRLEQGRRSMRDIGGMDEVERFLRF